MNSVSRVVVFSKSADEGTVKTRMRPELDDEKCLSLHVALLKDTLTKIRQFSSVLYLSGSGHLPFEPGLPLRSQNGADLGERMSNAFLSEFRNHSRVIIIGTDSPTFSANQISNGFSALDDHDVVLGPSEDGGYYLIGLRKHVPEMFSEIPWGSSDVFKITMERISQYNVHLLEKCFDVDVPSDLITLKNALEREDGISLNHLREWFTLYFDSPAR